MNKETLTKNLAENIKTTRNALQLVVDELNQGQQKKLVKNEEIKTLFDRYGVIYAE